MKIVKPFFGSAVVLTMTVASFLLFAASTAMPTRWKKVVIYPDATNFTLLGAAAVKNRTIGLTRDVGGGGTALYFRPVRFLEPATRSPASFSTRFTFSVDPSPSSGDGIAFLITSRPRFLGRTDGYMGLFDEAGQRGCGSENDTATVAVEFDTKLDASLRDINDNHVGVDVCSIVSVASADAGKVGVNLTGGVPIRAWIDYRSDTKNIKVWVGYSGFRPLDPVLVANVDLNRALRESMYIGFSASNCNAGCRALHTVYRWRFSTSFASYSSSAPSNVPPLVNNRSRALWVSVCIGGAVFVFLTAAAIAVAYRFKYNKESGGNDEREEPPDGRISLDVIKTATDGFDSGRILARGGFATTYEGVLPSGCKVVVKKFDRVELFTNTLATELAAVLDRSRHPNLVPFKGWCCEKDDLLLVYEFAANGSLYDALHAARSTRTTELPWDKRYNAVLGVAAALSFLHEECEKKIIHRDVRTRNVLLDANFDAKLADLGLAEIAPRPQATVGYLAPEYVHTGVPSEKTDVYSFGIVALETASGRKPVERGAVLVDWAWGLWGQQRLIEAADRRLRSKFKRDEMIRMLIVGLSCAHPDCAQRPSVRRAIRMLKGTTPLPVLPAQKPAVTLLCSLPQASEDSGASVSQWTTPCTSFNHTM